MRGIFRRLGLFGWLAVAGVAWADEADIKRELYAQGRWVYERECAVCHGERGRGDGPWADGVPDRPRNFRTGIYKFRSTTYGTLPTDDDLRRTIQRGISGTMMPTFKSLPEDQVEAVITYLKMISPRWRDPEVQPEPQELPAAPEGFADPEARAAMAKAGRAIYETRCAACHGPEAKGDGPAAAALVDVWGYKIVPADLTDPFRKSGDRLEDLFRTIALGLDGTPMLGFREELKDEGIWNLVAYLKSVERPRPPTVGG